MLDDDKLPARLVRAAFRSAERQFRSRTARWQVALARALQNPSAFPVSTKPHQS